MSNLWKSNKLSVRKVLQILRANASWARRKNKFSKILRIEMKNLILIYVFLLTSRLSAQFISVRDGDWRNPQTWSLDSEATAIPDSNSIVTVNHNAIVSGMSSVISFWKNSYDSSTSVRMFKKVGRFTNYGSLKNNYIESGCNLFVSQLNESHFNNYRKIKKKYFYFEWACDFFPNNTLFMNQIDSSIIPSGAYFFGSQADKV